ncbi:hypothetical protein [Alicyclobacillus kakegawensis]|uniref:hypothetical protein n=1 Tax=Alicyclobacillus kakegawensis TaxID=392012 RepID=UPI0008306CDB|nr:hypothetical protein [Alicyclobacillus kakegawensis]
MDTEQLLFLLQQVQRRLDEMLTLGRAVLANLPTTEADGERFAERIDEILDALSRRDESFRMLRELRLSDKYTVWELAQHADGRVRKAAVAVAGRLEETARQSQELGERLHAVQGELQDRLERVSRSLRFTAAYRGGGFRLPPGLRVNQQG